MSKRLCDWKNFWQFKNTVIVVSHDRHFLQAVYNHIGDWLRKITVYTGNYSFGMKLVVWQPVR
ncbi:MAG: hypothetical protein NZM38_02175 [Cytophagales bacterium]|nr:hypothetical protein [Cytophagales bacterium]MDW8383559.1 hypothetical protein [Flammeovirgaceae bacterium]